MHLFNDYYKNRRVLITGHGGFKGAWLAYLLSKIGAIVAGYSLLANTKERMYDVLNLKDVLHTNVLANICDEQTLNSAFENFKPEIVIHMAAQALVRLSYAEPIDTYRSNVMGTLHVLEAARKTRSVKTFINITTDKCYENKELDYKYKEDDPFGGYDIYSSSKACAEILTSSYRNSFLDTGKPFALASVRAGNVIGGGDWSIDRLIPDCVKAFSEGRDVQIRNPIAIRPWQHVLEPLMGYLLLGQKLSENPSHYAQGYNFGPEDACTLKVAEVAEMVACNWNNASGDANIIVSKDSGLHEAGLLQLDITKAKSMLGFCPVWSAETAIQKTTEWYKRFYNKNTDMVEYTDKQIAEFIYDAKVKNISWSL